jgi:two-component system, NarL family, sensor histidine kinase UhpB
LVSPEIHLSYLEPYEQHNPSGHPAALFSYEEEILTEDQLGVPLRVLIVEDDAVLAQLLEAILTEGDYGKFEAQCATCLVDALTMLGDSHFDAVLLDLSLPDSSNLETLISLHEHFPNVPVIVLTGIADEAVALRALRRGAQDYIVKGQMDNDMLVRSIRYAVERFRADRLLVESENRYRMLMEQASDGIFILDPSMKLIDANPAACEMLGYQKEDLLAMSARDLVVPLIYEDLTASKQALEDYQHGMVIRSERTVRRRDGTYLTLELSAKLLEDGRTIAIVRDVSERKQAEQTMQANYEAQANMLHQLLSAQEDERRRLSMDIHDGPLQSLGVSLLALDRAMRRLDRGETEGSRKELALLRSSLSNTVSEVRAVLADLSLELLTQYGLEIALGNHVERFSEVTGIELALHYNVRRRLSGDVKLLMYRLAQEGLANIRKHSRATKASVRLYVRGGYLHMVLTDNGRGFDPDAVLKMRYAGEKLGLRSIRERIELAGGMFEIHSMPGKGTRLDFHYPLVTRLNGGLR